MLAISVPCQPQQRSVVFGTVTLARQAARVDGAAPGDALLILPRQILEKIEPDLPRRATATDDVALAYRSLWSLYLARTRIAGAAMDRPDRPGRHPRAAEAGAGRISTCWAPASGFNVKRDDTGSGIDTEPVPKLCRDDHARHHCRDRDFKTRLCSSQTERR